MSEFIDVNMEFPQDVLDCARDAAKKHATNKEAVECAERNIRALGVFPELADKFFRTSVMRLVDNARHKINVGIRGDARGEGRYEGEPSPKVVVGASDAAREAFDYYSYCVAGRRLGGLRFDELGPIREGERERADVLTFHVRLLDWLEENAPKDKSALVKDRVPHAKLRRKFEELMRAG